jgi:hypothetical protein
MKPLNEASARDDLLAGFHYYEDKEDGLGRYFLVSLYSDIESLKVFGRVHRLAHRGFHRALKQAGWKWAYEILRGN